MNTWHRVIGASAALVVVLAACGDEVPRGATERKHCRAVLGFLNRNLGTTEIQVERMWEGDGMFIVALDYEVTFPAEGRLVETRQRDTLQCRYAPTPSDPRMIVEILGLHQRGVELDARQIRIVNTALKVFR